MLKQTQPDNHYCGECYYYRNYSKGRCETCDYTPNSGFSNWVPMSFNGTTMNDLVNNPKHYAGDIEPIDAIESWDLNFRLANVVKYVARHKKKGTPLQDLKKAMWYLKREIERWEDEDTP